MIVDEIRKKTLDELKTELRELLREQFNLRMQKSFSENIRPHSFKIVRRNIARVKTILREKAGEL
jgi:large subunit ribosomal protein L29